MQRRSVAAAMMQGRFTAHCAVPISICWGFKRNPARIERLVQAEKDGNVALSEFL